MKKTLLFLAFLLGIALQSWADTFTYSYEGKTLYYETTSNGAKVTYQNSSSPRYTNLSGALIIPESVTYNGVTCRVIAISDYAFQGCTRLTSVTIPNYVTSISHYAFSGCTGLTSVTIPTSVTYIGQNAFSGCTGLTGDLTIPNSVTSISNKAFYGCSGLTSVTIGTSVTSIGTSAFENCTGLCTISVPASVSYIYGDAFKGIKAVAYTGSATGSPWGADNVVDEIYWDGNFVYKDESKTYLVGYCSCSEEYLTIPSTVDTIGNYVFKGRTVLTSVTFPNSVTYIGDYAFQGCNGLTSITIPNSVTYIGQAAFGRCTGLTGDLTIPNSVTYIGQSAFGGCSGLNGNLSISGFASIGSSAFSGCSGLTGNLDLPNVTSIGSSAFFECSGLNGNISIPNATSIGSYAFYGCSGLNGNLSITNATTIGTWAFYECSGLNGDLNIPNVISIGNGAFYECSGLTGDINLPNDTTIGFQAFYGCSGLSGDLNIPNVTSIGAGAFYGCSGLNGNITLSDSITYIGDTAFCDLQGYIGTLTIPSTATYIGKYAFKNCPGITAVNYNALNPTSVTYPFYGCTTPATLNIANNVTTIPDWAFSYWSGLQSVTIPDSITRIGYYAFKGCTGLTSVNYNAINCTSMGEYEGTVGNYTSDVFMGCTAPTTLTIGNNVQRIPDNAFCGLNITGTLSIPNSVTRIGSRAFSGNNLTGSLNVPNSVTSIGDYAFAGTDITSAHLPDNPGIPAYCFSDCTELKIVSIGRYAGYIGQYAFSNCTSLQRFYSRSVTPPSLGSPTFVNLPSSACAYVPCGSTESYISSWGHYLFDGYRYWEVVNFNFNAVSNDETMGTVWINSGPYCSDSLATVSATANDGYVFDHWSDGSTDNPHTILVTSDMTITAYFGPTATVTATSDSATMGSAIGSGTYAIGGTATISANANTGYHFTQWQDGNTDNPRTIDVAGDTSFTAFFEINHYTVNVVSDNTALGSATGGGIFDHGTSTTISAEAATNYHFAHWQDGNTDNPRTITVTSDTTYTAYFAIDEYSITAVSDNTTMGTTSGSGSYAIGSSVTISAEANYGYHFTQWNDGVTDNPRTVTVTGNATYTAYFEPNQYTINVASDNTELGSATGGGTFDYGSTITISAEAVADYHFTHWNDGNTQNPRTVTVTGDATYSAYFAINEYTLTVVPNNTSYGTVAGGGTYAVGTTVTISAEANYGYHFTQWQDGYTDNPRTVTVTGNATYTANFEANNYVVTVLSDNPTMGTVTGGGTYAYGSTISISAQPAEGCWFAYWQDGNNDNPRYITVTGNAEYVAHFYRPEGIDDVTTADGMKIYTRGNTIVIDFNGQQAADGRQAVIVYDVMGRVIKQATGNGQQAAVEIPVTSAGVYMVKVGDQPSRKVAVRP